MTSRLRNPFYYMLLACCGALLITMFVYLVGWYYVPSPDRPAPQQPMPPWMRWIDRHALILIAAEVTAIITLTFLTIGLDRFFEPEHPKEKYPS